MEANVFTCPNCARPLANGANLCPGCGTRLIAGVRARLAIGFMAVGLDRRDDAGRRRDARRRWPLIAAADRDATPRRSPVPSAGTAAGRERRAASCRPTSAIPSKAVSALRQAAIINGRLAGYAAELDRPSRDGRPGHRHRPDPAVDVRRRRVRHRRRADRSRRWPEAADLSADLEHVLRRRSATPRRPASSHRSRTRAAYKAAGKRMAKLLAALPALDARAAEIVARRPASTRSTP